MSDDSKKATRLNISMMGNYSISQNKLNEDCHQCHNAHYGDVLIAGICGECLLNFFVANQHAPQEIVERDARLRRLQAACEQGHRAIERLLEDIDGDYYMDHGSKALAVDALRALAEEQKP